MRGILFVLFLPVIVQAKFEHSIQWAYNQSGIDALISRISYEDSSCKHIEFIQTAKLSHSDGRDFQWPAFTGQEHRNHLKFENWFIDVDNSKCEEGQGCSPYYTDHFTEESVKGSPAKMLDAPFGWTHFDRIELETCAYCINKDEFLNCMKWGGEFLWTGEKRILKARNFSSPSMAFLKAQTIFNDFYNP